VWLRCRGGTTAPPLVNDQLHAVVLVGLPNDLPVTLDQSLDLLALAQPFVPVDCVEVNGIPLPLSQSPVRPRLRFHACMCEAQPQGVRKCGSVLAIASKNPVVQL
jgi:hypothetical protein